MATYLQTSTMGRSPHLTALELELAEIRSAVAEVKDALADRPLVRHTFLIDLGHDKLALKIPIPILIEEYQDECLARWPEAEATGRGSTEPEAISSLRADITALFDDLSSCSEQDLAPRVLVVRRLLDRVITRGG